jgi:NADPH:quinone reductase-like Zn-dependent oxidoreductase
VRAVRIARFGGPDVLDVVEEVAPEPEDDEVLVRVVASSINPVDIKTRSNVYNRPDSALPSGLGWDVAGVVVSGSDGVEAGTRVVAMTAHLTTGRAAWADLVALPATAVVPAPRTLSLVEASALPLAGSTAWQSLQWLGADPGDRLLVTGGAGAVGSLAVQMAAHLGVRVDAVVRRTADQETVQTYGAAEAYLHPVEVPRHRYDAVLDTAGLAVPEAVREGGRYASIATEDGPLPDLRGRRVVSRMIGVVTDAAGLTEVCRLADEGVRPRIGEVYALRDVVDAARHAERRGSGRVVLSF